MLGVVFFTYFMHILSTALTFLSPKSMTLCDQIPCFLTFLTYYTLLLICCILQNNTRLYSFLWLTGRVLKKYFGKSFFWGDGSREQSFEGDNCYRLLLHIICCYRLLLHIRCCFRLLLHIGCCSNMLLHHALIRHHTNSVVASNVVSSQIAIHSMLLRQSWEMWVLFHIIVIDSTDCLFLKQ